MAISAFVRTGVSALVSSHREVHREHLMVAGGGIYTTAFPPPPSSIILLQISIIAPWLRGAGNRGTPGNCLMGRRNEVCGTWV